MASENETLEQVVRELRASNAALVEEVRAAKELIADTLRRNERRRAFLALAIFVVPVLSFAILLGGLTLFHAPREENPWERQMRQQWEQLDRTDRALDRAEKLLGRYEKVAPRE